MAVRHNLIKTDPATVWAVLADGTRYADWVVGTTESHPVRGRWPQVGAEIGYEIRLGPVRLSNETVVRRCVEGRELELEARAGALGTARIAIELRPWGEHCLVIVDEHPLQGASGALHNAGVEVLIQIRHRAMLARLAKVCEAEQRRGTENRTTPTPDTRPEPGSGSATGAGPASGASPATGASQAAGASSATATGASPETGASPASGASPETGASPASGASPATGASPASGASPATGASPASGASPATGASPASGSSPATGTGPAPDARPAPGGGASSPAAGGRAAFGGADA